MATSKQELQGIVIKEVQLESLQIDANLLVHVYLERKGGEREGGREVD